MIDTLSIRGAYRGKTLPETTIQILCDEVDRLRGEQPIPQEKTVEFVAVVYVDSYGNIARDVHSARDSLGSVFKRYVITATLPVPTEVEVVARVDDDKCPTCERIGDPACKTVGCAD